MSRQLDLAPLDEEWKLAAACRGQDPELWYPSVRGRARRRYNRQVLAAQRICLECPVIGECLQYALATDSRHGIWGGATELDRARLQGRKRVY